VGLSQLIKVMVAVGEKMGVGWVHVCWDAFSEFFFKSAFNVI
jgi:hypothetical protein